MRKKILFFCFCFVVKIISGYSQSACTFSTSFNATPVSPCNSILLSNIQSFQTGIYDFGSSATTKNITFSNFSITGNTGQPIIVRLYFYGVATNTRVIKIKNFETQGLTPVGNFICTWPLTTDNTGSATGTGSGSITVNNESINGLVDGGFSVNGHQLGYSSAWPTNQSSTVYQQFSVTPTLGNSVSLNSLAFTAQVANGSGTMKIAIQYSIDGATTFFPLPAIGNEPVTGLTYNWDYNGDGTNDLTTTATTNITHTYASAGVYNIRLISSNGSCNDTVYKSVAVGQPVVYVNQVATGANNGASWANAYTDLQTGINAAAACNAEVWVARGTYTPKAYPAGSAATTDTRYYAFYMLDSVKIFGGFVGTETIRTQRNFKNNSTILSGDIGTTGTNTDNCYHVMVNSGFPIDTVARLDGFTIKDGYSVGASSQVLTINGNDIDRRRDAGIYMHTASPHLINCIITTNSTSTSSSEGRGGGIFMQTGSPRIENSVFSNNSAGSGGGIHIREAVGTYNIVNSVFTGNTIGSSDGGGAIYLNSAALNLRNCTVYGNSSTTTNGGGIRRAGGTLNIINSIIWANTSTDASLLAKNIQNGSIDNIRSSIIQGYTTGGTGNSASDPLFINSGNPIGADGQWATNDDGIKISCSSPAINAGTNTNAPKIDIIGINRIGNPDIGAYETETFDISVNYNTQLCNAGIITPLITSPSTPTNQHFAYTAVHAPGNINLNSSTGSINLSTSDTGIYRIIFNGKISGCDVIDTTIVVIDSTQLKPTLTPNLVCAGTTPTFTAGNGSLFEFFKNGVSQGAASTTKIYTPSSLSGNDVICVRSYGPTFDGNFSASEWGQPLATSAGGPATSGFGAGNNIDAIYMRNDANYIYTAIAGNLVNNSNNRVLVFLDTKSGGFNSLSTWTNRTQAPYYSIENLNSSISFDAGFEPDYILGINQASGTVFYDLYDMQANVNTFLGEANTNPLLKFSPNTGVGDFTKGFEFAILRSALGNPTTNLKVFTMIVNDPGAGVPTYVSNQFLTRANNGESNYGNGTIPIVFSAAAPDPINYNFGDNCYTENCITVDGIPTPSAIIGNTNICKDSTTTLSNSVTGGIWIISNNTIATINSSTGTLTAINAGTTTIKYITTSNAGCKDSVSAIITVNAPTSSIVNVDTCGNSFVWKEITFNNSTNYIFDTTNIAGCDSSITLNLILRKPTSSSIDSSICQNSLPFTWNGLTFNNAGSQTATLVNAAGCDSIATLNLTLKSVSSSTTNISICATNYVWNGTNYTSSGTYTFSSTNAVGCDSIATLNLTLKSVSSSNTNISICANSYSWNGTNYTSSGTYTFNTTNAVGCDSVATLNLTLKSASSSNTNISICANSYSWNGTNYTSSGTYTFNTTNAAGCDSVATLNLTLKSVSSSTTNISFCATNYSWNGTNYTSSGTYTFNTTNAVGCDSVATLNLTLKSVSSSTTNISICATNYLWNGTNYTSSGTYTFNTTNAAGCDSIATLNLTLRQASSSISNVNICATNYLWNGTNYTSSGTYTFNTTNAVGCDSVVTLNLTLKSVSSSNTNISICATNYVWNGTNYTSSGTYTFSTTNAVGCDSIATLNLTLKSVSSSNTNISICATNYSWNGTNYTSSGTYTFNTTNAAGCDSIATLNLTLKSVSSSTTNINICATNYLWNGTNYTSSGTYTFSSTNAAGCDSIATLNLTLKSSSSSTTNINICATNYSWNGTNYTSSGTYTFTTTNAVGCDSIATLNLTLRQASSSISNVNICATNYSWNGTNYTSSGTYTFNTTNAAGCDSIATLNLTLKSVSSSTTNITACNTYTWNGIVYNTSGTYVRNGLINTVGCDSSARLILTIKKSSTANMTQAICVNQLPYTWNGIRFTTAGSRTITLVNTAGCDSVINFTLTLRPQPTIIMQDTFKTWPNVPIFLNGSISNATTVRWSPSQYLNFDTIQNPLATPPNNVEYVVTARNNNGCSTTKRIFVRMYKNIVIPNAFSPNGDGINDVWDLSSLSELPGFSVQIFNRYGNIVYQSKSFTQYWDGKRNGTNIPVGTYYYLIDIPNYKKLSGSLTILR